LLSPTASGKSGMIYALIKWHLNVGRKILLIVPSTMLVEQMYADFEDYSSFNKFSVNDNVQKLYSGFTKEFTKNVLISTWQSLITIKQKSFFEQFDVAIVDECHLAKAASISSVMEKCSNAKYRIGATGTIDESSKTNKLTLEGLFGPVYKVISTKELMDQGSVVNLKIKCVVLKYDEPTRKMFKGTEYQKELDWLVTHPERNKFIRNLAISTEGNTLVLFNYVDKHGKVLFEMIRNKVHDGRPVYFIHGGIDTKDREEIRNIVKNHNNAIIVASYGTLSTGTNIPSIQNVIFAHPSKSKIRNLQSIGRGLRLDDGKSECALFDIADNLQWKSWKNITLTHAIERYKIYAEEQFKMKIIEVDIK
jgi:superfamily II DNA or RNA helicase